MKKTVRIATRKSQLALWQAEHVRTRLLALRPDLEIELVKMTTEGDRILGQTLVGVGGKGLFIKELENALYDRRADLAVHSMKDVTVTLPDGLHIPAILEREDPRDAFVSNTCARLAELPHGARVGTASLRRQCQLRHAYPHLEVTDLRGNVNTRLGRLDAGEFDGIILAAAGLKRLGFDDRIRSLLSLDESVPAVAQGAIGVECRSDDPDINALIAPLNHSETARCILTERAMNAALQGGCRVPIGGYAELAGDVLRLRGLVGAPDGTRVLRAAAEGPAADPEELGGRVAQELLTLGAREILDAVYARQ